MPTFSVYFADDSPLASKVSERINQEFDKNASAYFRSLAERDFAGTLETREEGPLLELVKKLRGDHYTAAKNILASAKGHDPAFREEIFLGEIVRAAIAFLGRFVPRIARSGLLVVAEDHVIPLAYSKMKNPEDALEAIRRFSWRYEPISGTLGFMNDKHPPYASEEIAPYSDEGVLITPAEYDPPSPTVIVPRSDSSTLSEIPGSGPPRGRADNAEHLRNQKKKDSKQA